MTILVINGPNLNHLERRDPLIYGYTTLPEIEKGLKKTFPEVNFKFFQSNTEGEIVDEIQSAYDNEDIVGIIINPGAYAHYSYAIADALRDCLEVMILVEVHLSNIHGREDFRSKSVTAAAVDAVITGAGAGGYELAARYIISAHNREEGDYELPF